MRSAVLQLGRPAKAADRRAVARAAIRQLERADIYLAAVAAMEFGDVAAQRALRQVRHELDGLRHHLADSRSED